ncbi:MAG TPA: hypothetical protein PKM63_12205 [Panacibacter sp.]|nr:hypothetical protein [Panacibacter sp.]HNP45042.1 hypothetical protein [Panacibacter sp.]
MFIKATTIRPRVKFALALSAALTILSVSFAQDQAKELAASFDIYQQQNLKEKIFVHTDKNYYLAGEAIWFKLYVTDAGHNRPLDFSKVAYVEILDTANKAVLQAKVALQHAGGSGSFLVPLNINSGNYTFRAYTNWMKNAGADYFFQKNISIVNTQKSVTTDPVAVPVKYDVQFFPEGGNLVEGLQSKVAFKGSNQYGEGIAFSGALLDNDDTLVRFQPAHAGMGNFLFTPQHNHNYKAVIRFASGGFIVKSIPELYNAGYVMQVTDAGNELKISVKGKNTSSSNLFLLVHNEGGISYARSMSFKNDDASFTVDKSTLADGVSQISVFDEAKQPVCERLYFKKPAHSLQLALSADKNSYTKRSKVNLQLQLPGMAGAADSADLSVSVYRIDSLQQVDGDNIETSFMLTSSVKGYVEDPAYYFGDNAASAADDLMLTQGWRRFNWEAAQNYTPPAFRFAPELNGHIITGSVVNSQNGKRQPYIESFLSVPGTRLQFYPSTSDTMGNVKYEMKDFYGSTEISVQAGTQFDSIYRVEINNPFFEHYTGAKVPHFELPVAAANTLRERSVGMQVQQIYSGGKLKQLYMPEIDTSTFYLQPSKTYLLDDYTRFQTLEEVLREYVAMVNVTRREGRYHFPVFNSATKQYFEVDPINLVDGVPVFNLNKLMAMDPLLIRKLEVINQRYIYGGSSFNGILNWTTYKGDLGNLSIDPSTVLLDYEALQLQREFYTPAYDSEEKRNSHLPDFRNVLYWSPNIKASNSSNQPISFYSSDLPGKYAVQVQGLSATGNCGSKVIFINVDK